MTLTPTPEEFLAQPSSEEDDLDELPVVRVPQTDPLMSMAASLERIAAAVQERAAEPEREARAAETIHTLAAELDDLQAKYEALSGLVDDVLAVCKPSVSKLANQVRETVAKWRDPEVERVAEPEPVVETLDQATPPPPAADAPVEEWREFARSRGYAGPDVDKANRSQIRTVLGLPHSEA